MAQKKFTHAIELTVFFALGGNLEFLKPKDIILCDYTLDMGEPIKKISLNGDKGDSKGNPLLDLVFKNGKTKVCDAKSIQVTVELELHTRYTYGIEE